MSNNPNADGYVVTKPHTLETTWRGGKCFRREILPRNPY